MAKLMADPLRIDIAIQLGKREMSATEFYERFGSESDSVPRIARHFKVLEEYGWIEEVGTKTGGRRRGATERFYRARRPAALFTNDDWAELPDALRSTVLVRWISTFNERFYEAFKAGTLDSRDDHHATWTPLSMDETGWENVLRRVDALFYFLSEEQERANARMEQSGEEPIEMTVGLAAFESPKEQDQAET